MVPLTVWGNLGKSPLNDSPRPKHPFITYNDQVALALNLFIAVSKADDAPPFQRSQCSETEREVNAESKMAPHMYTHFGSLREA